MKKIRMIVQILFSLVIFLIPQIIFGQTKLVIASWGGALQDAQRKAFFEPFEKETGIKIIEDTTAGFGKLKAMVEAKNVEWDVVDLGERHVIVGGKEGLLEPIDFRIVKKENFFPQAIREYGVAALYYSSGIGYSTRRYSPENHPTNWTEFWDVNKFPGPRTLRDDPKDNLDFALMADGVSFDKLYPLDVERAFKSLDKIKKHVKVWWKAGAHPVQLLVDGEVDFAGVWQGRIITVKAEGAKVDFEYNQATLLSDWWAVPKGAKNKEAAMKFIQFTSEAKNQANWSTLIAYGPVNPEAYKYLSKERAKILPTSPENIKKLVVPDEEWWAANYHILMEKWRAWMLK